MATRIEQMTVSGMPEQYTMEEQVSDYKAELDEANAVCAQRGMKLDEQGTLIQKLNTENDELKFGMSNRDDTINRLAGEVLEWERTAMTHSARINELLEEVNNCGVMLTSTTTELVEVREINDGLNNTIQRLMDRVSELTQERDMERSEKRDALREKFEDINNLKRAFAQAVAEFPEGCRDGKWEFMQFAGVDEYAPTRTMKLELEVQVPWDPQFRAQQVTQEFENVPEFCEDGSVIGVTVVDYNWDDE
jgi:chromosome segregation ATPase